MSLFILFVQNKIPASISGEIFLKKKSVNNFSSLVKNRRLTFPKGNNIFER